MVVCVGMGKFHWEGFVRNYFSVSRISKGLAAVSYRGKKVRIVVFLVVR